MDRFLQGRFPRDQPLLTRREVDRFVVGQVVGVSHERVECDHPLPLGVREQPKARIEVRPGGASDFRAKGIALIEHYFIF
jgi:hypothetical protein